MTISNIRRPERGNQWFVDIDDIEAVEKVHDSILDYSWPWASFLGSRIIESVTWDQVSGVVITNKRPPQVISVAVAAVSPGSITDEKFYVVTASLDGTEHGPSAEVSIDLVGENGRVTWIATPGAEFYRVYVGTSTGVYDRYVELESVLSYTDVGAALTASSGPPAQSQQFFSATVKNSGTARAVVTLSTGEVIYKTFRWIAVQRRLTPDYRS